MEQLQTIFKIDCDSLEEKVKYLSCEEGKWRQLFP